jgi:hypothetical protein
MDVALPFASCFLLLPSLLGNFCIMAEHIIVASVNVPPSKRTLSPMREASPDGSPPPLENMPDWALITYDQFAGYYPTVIHHPPNIPLTNVNVHSVQRPIDQVWLTELSNQFHVDNFQTNTHPGVLILNAENLSPEGGGNTNPFQMLVS